MRFVACSVFDSAVNTYSPPIFVRSLGLAIRDFRREAADSNSRIAQSPTDFVLFVVGEYDDESATMTALPAPRRVISATEAKEA